MKKKKLLILSVIILCFTAFCLLQNNYLTVSHYTIVDEKIDASLDGYRIVQVSDLHNKNFGNRLLNKIEKQNPNIIVITGDIADSNHTDIETALEFVQGAVKIAPVYYITGNHELWLYQNDRKRLLQGITSVGARHLENEYLAIEHNGVSFNLIGLDDRNLNDNTLTELMNTADTSKFTAVLAHEPQYMENYAKSGAELILSGHVHGGQVRLPFVGGLLSPEHGFFPEYDAGEFVKGDTTMIVSRGLGNSVIPLRVFNFPEVVCVELKTK